MPAPKRKREGAPTVIYAKISNTGVPVLLRDREVKKWWDTGTVRIAKYTLTEVRQAVPD